MSHNILTKLFAALLFLLSATVGVSALPTHQPNATLAQVMINGWPPFIMGGTLSPITHVLFIVQENRTPDNLFCANATLVSEGADLACTAQDYFLQQYPMAAVPLTFGTVGSGSGMGYDLDHSNRGWNTECWWKGTYTGGCNMTGAMNEGCQDSSGSCASECPVITPNPVPTPTFLPSPTPTASSTAVPLPTSTPDTTCAFGYVPTSGTHAYQTIATTYVFGDKMFQTSRGPSYPAHQDIIRGSTWIADNNQTILADNNPGKVSNKFIGGCDSPLGSTVTTRTATSLSGNPTSNTYPCFSVKTILSELEAAGDTWKYYQNPEASPYQYGLWTAPDSISGLGCVYGTPSPTCGSDYTNNVVSPPSQFITDVGNGHLSSLTIITPTAASSDHAGTNDGTGPTWVASVINAVGNSSFWNSTAIFVIWDDWGGWYDHDTPYRYGAAGTNTFQVGFRVPFLIVSAYTPSGVVDHTNYEFGSLLKYVETNFGLPSLNSSDVLSNNISSASINYRQAARTFTTISYDHVIQKRMLARMAHDTREVDY